MLTEEQQLLSRLYELEDSLSEILEEQKMYKEIYVLQQIIKKIEFNVINQVGSWGI